MSSTNDEQQPTSEASLSPEAMHNLIQFITTLMEMDKQYEDFKKWNKSKEKELENDK